MHTDQELLNRIITGDDRALEELYRAYYHRLSRFLLRVARDPDLVIEIINDVFLVVWEKGSDFRGDASVSSWIIGIAYRKALKSLNKLKPFVSFENLALNLVAADDATQPSLELESSLARLSPEHRAVIELSYFFGYSYREIGDILECPENTVKTRMFHARRMMQSIMEV